jgi:DNA-binding LacI/PurR family transcriptional regulator
MTVAHLRPQTRRPAVMADVAQLAGVSHQTVSRVLHDSPEAAHFTPPLTTVRQDFTELGRRCPHILLGRIEGEAGPTRVVVAPELVVRGSTGAAPKR